ncbi:MAG: hypothetical protein J7L95_07815 [Prolixibacteraceae bacterium]|nr:hypothetical protein [Prolixibacteraceae bacterium]
MKNARFFDAFLILFLIEKGLNFTQIGILYATRQITTFQSGIYIVKVVASAGNVTTEKFSIN